MRAKFVYEKFEQDTDPIHDMGIGAEYIAKKFINELKEIIPWLVEEPELITYKKQNNSIIIDCYPLSRQGLSNLKNALDELLPKYKHILKLTYLPTYGNMKDDWVADDWVAKIKII